MTKNKKNNKTGDSMPTKTIKNIHITGDFIFDKNIIRKPGRKKFYDECPETIVTEEHGGAWFTTDIIRQLIAMFDDKTVNCLDLKDDNDSKGSAVALWDMHSKKKGSKDKCWRISEFLGCQKGKVPEDAWIENYQNLTKEDLLIIDDTGLGYADSCDINILASILDNGVKVIIKTANLKSKLWQELFKKDCANGVTLVTTGDAIREVGGTISRGFSWDKTIEDVKSEFGSGPVGELLGKCERAIVLFGTEGIGLFTSKDRTENDIKIEGRLNFEQFIYSPVCIEGTKAQECEGIMPGKLSILTAAIAASMAVPEKLPRFAMCCRTLAALECFYENGAGDKGVLNDLETIMVEPLKLLLDNDNKCINKYGVAFPREILDEGLQEEKSYEQTLLTDASGRNHAFIMAVARDIVKKGPEKVLSKVPYVKYGNYTTYDKEEIERIHCLKNLIVDYLNTSHPRPLCIAVFGQPGSGKSFAIKNLAKTLFKDKGSQVTFNLSQFESVQDLYGAFHQVRDMSLSGNVPLVFWDEFDSSQNGQKYFWLKEFLAPMQDGEFNEGGCNHPIGRAIFVFAGGTSTAFEQFSKVYLDDVKNEDSNGLSAEEEKLIVEEQSVRKLAKLPDFVSRLRGYINIKGPNPVPSKAVDNMYPIRRALLTRTFIEIYFKNSMIGSDNEINIAPGVLDALLSAEKYLHGARSLEAIVSYSHLNGTSFYGPSELPPQELLDIHVKNDFMKIVTQGQRYLANMEDFVLVLAERIHEKWKKLKEEYGWTLGDKVDKINKKHNLLKDYAELSDTEKADNIEAARNMLMRLSIFGIEVVPEGSSEVSDKNKIDTFDDELCLKIAIIEHNRWMRGKLRKGFVHGVELPEAKYVHENICKYSYLSEEDKKLDLCHIDALMEVKKDRKMALIKKPKNQPNDKE